MDNIFFLFLASTVSVLSTTTHTAVQHLFKTDVIKAPVSSHLSRPVVPFSNPKLEKVHVPSQVTTTATVSVQTSVATGTATQVHATANTTPPALDTKEHTIIYPSETPVALIK